MSPDQLPESWRAALAAEFSRPYFLQLREFLAEERANHQVFPPEADVFNAFDRQTEGRFLAALDQGNRGSAKRIRELMFTFEDLNRLDSAGLQVLLRSVEKERLALALKGAPEELREMFFRNMTERAAKLLRDDVAALGPVRLRDVDEAQAAVVVLAKDMAAQGQLTLKGPGDDEMVA